jgi:hypothetical protein
MTHLNETTPQPAMTQPTEERTASCCSPARQAVCCEPEDKASCCGAKPDGTASPPGTCGCQS